MTEEKPAQEGISKKAIAAVTYAHYRIKNDLDGVNHALAGFVDGHPAFAKESSCMARTAGRDRQQSNQPDSASTRDPERYPQNGSLQ